MSTTSLDSLLAHGVAPRILREPFKTWAGHKTDYPEAATISSLFEEVAAAQPDSVALVSSTERISYRELNARANSLALLLKEHGVGREKLIALCTQRSVASLVAVLAVLKAGGAYVPLDPGLPPARMDALLAETRPCLLLLDETSLAPNSDLGIAQLRLDDDFPRRNVSRQTTGNLPAFSTARNLAYVMYTSGSTGQPKGVMVEHRSVIRLVRKTSYCEFGPQHVFLHAAPLSFDASTFEIWGALLNGSTLVVLDSPRISLDAIARAIRDNGVTTLWLTSSLFSLMIEQHLRDLTGVRQLLGGGDVLSARHVRKALDALPNCRIINGYGPTENTTFTCCHSMRRGDLIPDSVPLGKPISNTFVHVLSPEGNPVEIGEPGELFAGGDGLARGYLNDPQMTAEHFLPDPFSTGGKRMYRTGDLARWSDKGEIEFLGRADDQIKIRGYRVEPLEIVRALEAHPQIAQACVLADPLSDAERRLVAYYTSPAGLAQAEVREHLQERIPEYMIPAVFVPVQQIPLSANGKIDRDALLSIRPHRSIAESSARLANASHAATNDPRKVLQEIWRSVLKADDVGLDDNFFDLGGDSLLLMSIHSRLQTQLSLKLPIMDLFEFTTIRKLAKRIAELQASSSSGPARGGETKPSETATAVYQRVHEQRLERQ